MTHDQKETSLHRSKPIAMSVELRKIGEVAVLLKPHPQSIFEQGQVDFARCIAGLPAVSNRFTARTRNRSFRSSISRRHWRALIRWNGPATDL